MLGNVKIQMFVGDHNPPHFHVVTPDGEAVVELGTLRVLRSSIRSRELATAITWAKSNAELLGNEWRRLNSEI